MRRSLALVLALVSLTLQLNAPVHAAVMLTAEQGSALCAEHTGSTKDRKTPPGRPEACAACVSCAATATVAGSEHRFEPVRYAARLTPEIIADRSAFTGPPAPPPRARGPPTTA